MALQDPHWRIHYQLQYSTPYQLTGCHKYLKERLDERKTLAKKASFTSYMTQSEARDFRAYFPEFSSLSVIRSLSMIEHRAV